jgi:2-octaprenyl-6-methoxyphenol hydroxylase
MTRTLDVAVAVVGAGPVGATLACALAEAGVPTAVIDQAPLPPMEEPAFDGRAYAVARGSRAVLEQAGVWARLGAHPCPILGIRVSDGVPGRRASPFTLDFDAREADGAPSQGSHPFGWMVEARHLRIALNAQLPRIANLHCFAPARIAEVARDAEHATLRLADGTAISARLVVGAEGRNSPLREQAGIGVTRFAYNQAALVCAVAHERPHGNIAVEHFLPAGPFAILPLNDSDGEHRSAIVWTDRPAAIARLHTLPDAALSGELARRFGTHLGRVAVRGLRWTYPLGVLHAHRYTDTRLALAGDAAHGIHPIAGQGLNLGFRDAGALAEILIGVHRAKLDPGAPEFLRAYERARRGPNLAMLYATDALDRLFSTDLFPVRLARGLGIAVVDRLPRLKRVFMRTAMGL